MGVRGKKLFESDENKKIDERSERVFLPPMLLVLLATKVRMKITILVFDAVFPTRNSIFLLMHLIKMERNSFSVPQQILPYFESSRKNPNPISNGSFEYQTKKKIHSCNELGPFSFRHLKTLDWCRSKRWQWELQL